MLSESELSHLCRQLGLSKQTQLVIEEIRRSPPARRVRSAAGNVSVRYPSRKMGVVIQAESHKVELARIYEMEYDDNVLEYYDQPPSIKLTYRARSGRPITVVHTPDFFVIQRDAVGWEELKTEQGLRRQAEDKPHRYVQGENGQWCCPPGERYAAQFGLYYHVRSSAEINWALQRNLIFLEDYLHDETPRVKEGAAQAVLSLVAKEPGIRLDELLKCAQPASSDDIYTLIVLGQLYVDLCSVPLAEADRVSVFIDEETSRAYAVMLETSAQLLAGGPGLVEISIGAMVSWDGRTWMIANAGETTITLVAGEEGFVELPQATFESLVRQSKIVGGVEQARPGISPEAKDLLARASVEELQEANRRAEIVRAALAGQTIDSALPKRRIHYWLSRYRQAEQRYGYGYLGLLRRHYQKGNRQRKLPASTLAMMDQFIEANYETLKQKNRREVYGELVLDCQRQGILPPSYKRFAQAVRERPGYEQTEKRQGKRAAEQKRPFYWELERSTPRHGDRPFEVGHIDHTELDIELVCPRTGHHLGRPWATFLTDAFSRRLLAVYVTFDPPSYRSCMMVLRECVRRYGRLPQFVVVDGGAEFQGVYFETLLAFYGCAKKKRPQERPRFGSVCERLFGTSNTEFIHNLAGNTQVMVNVRQVTKLVNPKEHAIWTLGRLHARLCEWAYEVYDTIEQPALGQSPRAEFTLGLMQSGARPQRLIPYDENFKMMTLPTTSRGKAMIRPNQGVKINYIYYWSDAFRNPEVEKTRVDVRYDPFDAGLAYAYVDGRWVRCISEHYAAFKGRSEREIKLASEALRKKNQRHAQQFTLTARRLADFVTSVEAEEVLLEQRLRDASNREVLAMIGRDRSDDERDRIAIGLAAYEIRDETKPADKLPARDKTSDYDHLEVYGVY
jgi:putative transposase